jgi:hypothetical protein
MLYHPAAGEVVVRLLVVTVLTLAAESTVRRVRWIVRAAKQKAV